MSAGRIVLLAEGRAEVGFLQALMKAQGWAAEVRDLKGERNLPAELKALRRKPPAGLAVMMDANDDPRASLQRVNKALADTPLSLRQDPVIFLSPGPDRPGAIEDLILDEITGRPGWDCVEAAARCADVDIDSARGRKTLVQLFVSLQDGSVCGAGVAFQRGVLDCAHAAYAPIRAALAPLFADA